jgi:hypothetical protein
MRPGPPEYNDVVDPGAGSPCEPRWRTGRQPCPAVPRGGTYARGLNAASGERGATGAAAGMVANPVTILGGVGLLEGEGTDQITLGAGVSADIAPLGVSGRLAVQTGVGWLQSQEFGDDLSFLRFPVGIAVKGRIEGATSALTFNGTALTLWPP